MLWIVVKRAPLFSTREQTPGNFQNEVQHKHDRNSRKGVIMGGLKELDALRGVPHRLQRSEQAIANSKCQNATCKFRRILDEQADRWLDTFPSPLPPIAHSIDKASWI